MKAKTLHPQWALAHRKPGTELKLINGNYYLYGVKSVYDKVSKHSKKISLGIIGRITEEKGLIPSDKNELKQKSEKTYLNKQVFSLEYGLSKWLLDTLEKDGTLAELKKHFPDLWQFIVMMVFCRIGYQSPLKNIPFHTEQSNIQTLLGLTDTMTDQKICDLLFELGSAQKSIHEFIKPKNSDKKTVLMDATDMVLASKHIPLAQKGYNSNLNFQSQFVLLYMYDANSLEPLYYRLLPGNVREISAMQNTIKISGLEQCVYIADKGFFSEANIAELERLNMSYIIPLKRDNKLIPYASLDQIEQSNNYFEYAKRFIFYAAPYKDNNRNICLYADGRLKEEEKTDYLARIKSIPESFSKEKFNAKLQSMGTLAIMHNTDLNSQEIYLEYKNRGEIEQFFDHLKNTLYAGASNMQREASLNGWMFINHLSMKIIYKLFFTLKNIPLNKKQKLNHKYSIKDVIEHLKAVKIIKFGDNESVIAERNKATKTLLDKMNISVT
jgi:transposase